MSTHKYMIVLARGKARHTHTYDTHRSASQIEEGKATHKILFYLKKQIIVYGKGS